MQRRSFDVPGPRRERLVAALKRDMPAILLELLRLRDDPRRHLSAEAAPVVIRPLNSSANPHARKLTAADVRQIRERQREGVKFDPHDLAEDYGCGAEAIRRVLRGESWTKVVV